MNFQYLFVGFSPSDRDNTSNRPLHEAAIAATGTVVHLKGYGFVKVYIGLVI
jgi:hypothetical protein